MQCNQAFCGNPFANGPFCDSYNTPLQPNQGMYPEIVGEGQVTSITLPDGSVQFFFIPTLKWRSATQCHQFATTPNPMFANNNNGIPPQCNNNGGSWFIRSILPYPQNVCLPSSQRNEFPRLGIMDFSHNLNSLNFGCPIKFHNDAWSSTTDLVYFYPSLRQRDFVYTLPCKDKTVQIDTGPAACVCHYEVVRSKPCHCTYSVPAPATPMSLEYIRDPKSTPKNNSSTVECCCSKQSSKSEKNKKKNIMWACDSKPKIDSVDKSITTYADEGCDCTPAGGRETQTQPENKDLLKPMWTAKSYSGDSTSECSCTDITKKSKRSQYNAKSKFKKKRSLLKTRWPAKIFSGDSMSVECSCDDVSKKSNNGSKDKPMYKSPLKSKRAAKSFSGDSMSVECSCDDLSKTPNNRSQDKPRSKSGQSTSAKSFSSDSMSVECSCEDLSKKPDNRSQAKPRSKSGQPTSVECACDDISNKLNNRSEDYANPMNGVLNWIAKSLSGDSKSVECPCDDLSKKPTNRSEDNTEAKLKHKALLMPKWTAKSGQSMSVECSCYDISKKANKRSEDNADAKVMHKALLMPKWTAKSYSGDLMTEECACDEASKKPNVRVNKQKYKRCKPKKCGCGCDSASSVTDKGGRGKPFTRCSTCSITCCTSALKSKYSPKNLAQTTSRVKSDNLCPDYKLKEEEMRETSTNPSSEQVLERKSSEHIQDTCLDCDTVASISGEVKCE